MFIEDASESGIGKACRITKTCAEINYFQILQSSAVIMGGNIGAP